MMQHTPLGTRLVRFLTDLATQDQFARVRAAEALDFAFTPCPECERFGGDHAIRCSQHPERIRLAQEAEDARWTAAWHAHLATPEDA